MLFFTWASLHVWPSRVWLGLVNAFLNIFKVHKVCSFPLFYTVKTSFQTLFIRSSSQLITTSLISINANITSETKNLHFYIYSLSSTLKIISIDSCFAYVKEIISLFSGFPFSFESVIVLIFKALHRFSPCHSHLLVRCWFLALISIWCQCLHILVWFFLCFLLVHRRKNNYHS